MLRVQSQVAAGTVPASAHSPGLSECASGKNAATRVFPLCPTITHTTNQACGFLPEEQELVRELLNAKSESNRNKKEVGESREETRVSSQSPCALGRMSQEPRPLLRIQASTVGAAAGTRTQHSSFTLSGASWVCPAGRRQSLVHHAT